MRARALLLPLSPNPRLLTRQDDILFCLPRLPRTLLSGDKQLMLAIVDHQWAGHSGAGADFQAWRKTRSQGMMPTRTVAAVVPALRRLMRVCGQRDDGTLWCACGAAAPRHGLELC